MEADRKGATAHGGIRRRGRRRKLENPSVTDRSRTAATAVPICGTRGAGTPGVPLVDQMMQPSGDGHVARAAASPHPPQAHACAPDAEGHATPTMRPPPSRNVARFLLRKILSSPAIHKVSVCADGQPDCTTIFHWAVSKNLERPATHRCTASTLQGGYIKQSSRSVPAQRSKVLEPVRALPCSYLS